MGVRHEKVILDLDDRLSGPIGRSSASVSMFKRNVDDSGRSVIAFDRTVKSTGPSIDQFSGRLQILIRTAALLGPAFGPLLTSIVPAVVGLSTELGFAAAAGGVAVLAFQGVGDALKTLNEARLDPTAENLEKAREAMMKLSPAAQQVVVQLQEMRSELRGLRDAASEGLMPGVSDSLDNLDDLFPRFERIIGNIASATGDMLGEGTQSLTTDRWEDFFAFLESEARPTIEETARTVGDLTHGLAELWMQLSPLSRDFTGGLANAADDFDRWATGLDETEGYQEFLDYVMQTGPQVIDTVGALANAILQIGVAAAPLGGPVLQMLEAFADTVSAIAESDIGTPIMTAVTALSALRLAQLAWGKAADTTFMNSERSLGSFVDRQRQAARDVMALGGSGNLFSKYDPKAKAARAGLADLGKTAGVAGGLALAASGAADKIGLTNTASLALIGTMAGPWGAAIGGGVGLLMDMSSAGDDVTTSINAMNRALASGDLDAWATEAEKARAGINDLGNSTGVTDFVGDQVSKIGLAFGQVKSGNLFGGITDGLEDDLQKAESDFEDLRLAIGEVGGETDVSLGRMREILASSRPAMDALGISVQDLAQGARDGSIIELGNQIRSWNDYAGSAAGRTDVFVSAIDDLADSSQSAEARVEGLQSAMESMLSPGLNLSAATDAWRSGLRNLTDELAKNGRSLTRNTNAGDKNRAAIRQRVSELRDLVVAQQAIDPSGRRAARTLEAGARAIIRSGIAAGLSEGQIRQYLRQLGLTPKAINTAIRVSGVAEARTAAASVRESLAAIRDRHVQIFVHQNTIANKPKATPGNPDGLADGGTVPGQRWPYGDKTLILAAPGEEVITNRYGQADQFRADRAAGRIPAYADGGTVDRDRARYAGTRGGGGQQVVVIGGKLTGRIDSAAGPIDFMVELEQMAHRAARREIDADRHFWEQEDARG